MKFLEYEKLQAGDRVAVVSPSFAAPGKWPHVFELGLKRMREQFGLMPVTYPTTAKIGASGEERARDLVAAFADNSIKAVFASLGGDDQVTYIKNLPSEVFRKNPKPYFGTSDNTHFMNHLWLHGVPSYYGGTIFTQFAKQVQMDEFTVSFLRKAIFEQGNFQLKPSPDYNDVGLDWSDPSTLNTPRMHEPNDGWFWSNCNNAEGITWGGCLESVDELLRHGITLPSLDHFSEVILFLETSEEIPPHDYVRRVMRALGERGILARVQGLLVGRPKAWEFDKPATAAEKANYRKQQRETIQSEFETYNSQAPVIQNMDFGHTDPQICLPFGRKIMINGEQKLIHVNF